VQILFENRNNQRYQREREIESEHYFKRKEERKKSYSGINRIFEISIISKGLFSQITQILFENRNNQRYQREREIERIDINR